MAGDPEWADISASVTVQLPSVNHTTEAFICARVGATGDGYNDGQAPPGYCVKLTRGGLWTVVAGKDTLGHGKLASTKSDGRYRLSIETHGSMVAAAIDGNKIFTISSLKYHRGQIAIGSSFVAVRFDDVAVDEPIYFV